MLTWAIMPSEGPGTVTVADVNQWQKVLDLVRRLVRAPAPTDQPVGYPGDADESVTPVYAPKADGRPDPGEVVWTWVPYEEDASRGKDRPVLLIGHDGPWLLALPLTSKDHDRDAAQEAALGRHWIDIGSGAWDPRGRPSEVRVDRVIRVDPDRVRREGAVLDRARFEAVAQAVRLSRGDR